MMRVAAALLLCVASLSAKATVCDLEFSEGVTLQSVPVATSTEEQQTGLSDRDGAGQGMLFVWEEPAPRVFTMRYTRIPLSIAFIDQAGVVFMIQDMQPESEDRYLSILPAVAALEVRQGEFEEKGVVLGSRLIDQTCGH